MSWSALVSRLLVQMIFGWPAIIVSILLSITGVYSRKSIYLVAAGIACIPFTYDVSAGFRSPALLLPLFHFGAACAIQRKIVSLAWSLIAPLILVAGILAYAVLTQ